MSKHYEKTIYKLEFETAYWPLCLTEDEQYQLETALYQILEVSAYIDYTQDTLTSGTTTISFELDSLESFEEIASKKNEAIGIIRAYLKEIRPELEIC